MSSDNSDRNSRSNSPRAVAPRKFKGGTFLGVGLDVNPELDVEIEKEAPRARARQAANCLR